MHRLRVAFAPYWQSIQHALFPPLERVLGPLTEKQQQVFVYRVIQRKCGLKTVRNPQGSPHFAM